MSITEKETRNLTDHDLLIRIDERLDTVIEHCKDHKERLDKMNGLKPRITRLEAIVAILFVMLCGTAAGVTLIG